MSSWRVSSQLTLSYTAASVDAVTLMNFPGLIDKDKDIEPKTHVPIGVQLHHRFFLFSVSQERKAE